MSRTSYAIAQQCHPDNEVTAVGAYDPDELVAVPAWTVKVARGLAATLAHCADLQKTIDFGQQPDVDSIVEAATAFNPLPEHEDIGSTQQLAELLQETAQVLSESLQNGQD
ncbi:hypothetical protein GA0070616_0144 [Micromonospora nigra]|uniref:Uncharacterized protein n=1 Tax=Micromonospora nigra TaxID=145857 RepID=A0A1C6R7X3_9ACTN|nr:hypothetical protein [Micromonospora nigra]SCL13156.1 hypothetical protein GA0070616_0144 [Micromonospora nigra]